MKKNLTISQQFTIISNKQFKTKESENIIKEIENIETKYKYFASNVLNEEQNALQKLMNSPDVILKPTGKGCG